MDASKNCSYESPSSLMRIFHNIRFMVEDRIRHLKDNYLYQSQPHLWEYSFLIDLQGHLMLAPNMEEHIGTKKRLIANDNFKNKHVKSKEDIY